MLFEERMGVIDHEFKTYVDRAEEAASPKQRQNRTIMTSYKSTSPTVRE